MGECISQGVAKDEVKKADKGPDHMVLCKPYCGVKIDPKRSEEPLRLFLLGSFLFSFW